MIASVGICPHSLGEGLCGLWFCCLVVKQTSAATFEIVRRSQIVSDSERMSIQNLANPGMCLLFFYPFAWAVNVCGRHSGSHQVVVFAY